MTKGVSANIIFLSKPNKRFLLKTAMVKLFLGFQGQKRLSQLLYGIHAAPLSSENSADNKIELIALLHATVKNMMSQHFIE